MYYSTSLLKLFISESDSSFSIDTMFFNKDFVDKMFKEGLECSSLFNFQKDILDDKLVVGRVSSVNKHPNANKLIVCNILISNESSSIVIVTGASNVFEGDYVCVALNGCKFYDGVKIKTSKLRGVESSGMMCSKGELCYSEFDFNGLWILPCNSTIGRSINNCIDNVVNVEVLNNSAHILSHIGFARDLSRLLSFRFNSEYFFKEGCVLLFQMFRVDFEGLGGELSDDEIEFTNNTEDICYFYSYSIIKSVSIKESSNYLKYTLAELGLNSVNNIVDILNLFTILLGQPFHVYDLNAISDLKLEVKSGSELEFISLKQSKYNICSADNGVYSGGKILSLIGVVGGLYSSVNLNTKNILIESVGLSKEAVYNTSNKHGIFTMSTKMFTYGIDIFNISNYLDFCIKFLYKKSNTKIAYKSSNLKDILRLYYKVYFKDILKVFGLSISNLFKEEKLLKYITSSIKSIDVSAIIDLDKDFVAINIPHYRFDITSYDSLLENIIRKIDINYMEGIYSSNQSNNINFNFKSNKYKTDSIFITKYTLEDLLISMDFHQIVTPCKSNVLNGISLRNNLFESLLMFSVNSKHSKVFELGKIFDQNNKSYDGMSFAINMDNIVENYFDSNNTFNIYDIKSIIYKILDKLNILYDHLIFNSLDDIFEFAGYRFIKTNVLIKNIQIFNIYRCCGSKLFLVDIDLKQLSNINNKFFKESTLSLEYNDYYNIIYRDITFEFQYNISPLLLYNEMINLDYIMRLDLMNIFKKNSLYKISYRLTFKGSDRSVVDKQFDSIVNLIKTKFNGLLRNK